MNNQQILLTAQACHNANKAYCELIGYKEIEGTSVEPVWTNDWEDNPEWYKNVCINDVTFLVKNPNATAQEMHELNKPELSQEDLEFLGAKDKSEVMTVSIQYSDLDISKRTRDVIFVQTFRACKAALETAFTPKEDFIIVEEGTNYRLPLYDVVDGVGIVQRPMEGDGNAGFHLVCFVRGSKLGEENVEKRTGTLHEHLLACMIHDLEFKNKLVPSPEGALVITKLKEALGWLRQRQIDRTKRNVVGTYQK